MITDYFEAVPNQCQIVRGTIDVDLVKRREPQ